MKTLEQVSSTEKNNFNECYITTMQFDDKPSRMSRISCIYMTSCRDNNTESFYGKSTNGNYH